MPSSVTDGPWCHQCHLPLKTCPGAVSCRGNSSSASLGEFGVPNSHRNIPCCVSGVLVLSPPGSSNGIILPLAFVLLAGHDYCSPVFPGGNHNFLSCLHTMPVDFHKTITNAPFLVGKQGFPSREIHRSSGLKENKSHLSLPLYDLFLLESSHRWLPLLREVSEFHQIPHSVPACPSQLQGQSMELLFWDLLGLAWASPCWLLPSRIPLPGFSDGSIQSFQEVKLN